MLKVFFLESCDVISWDNLILDLSDSAANMKGKSSGVESEEVVNRILVDKTLPKAIVGDDSIQLDKWWSVTFNTGKYPVL